MIMVIASGLGVIFGLVWLIGLVQFVTQLVDGKLKLYDRSFWRIK